SAPVASWFTSLPPWGGISPAMVSYLLMLVWRGRALKCPCGEGRDVDPHPFESLRAGSNPLPSPGEGTRLTPAPPKADTISSLLRGASIRQREAGAAAGM